MRRLIFVLLFFPIFSFSQKDYITIRDYKKSLVVGFSENASFNSIYNVFGGHAYNQYITLWNRYSYTAQEYNTNLGLFFFPKRTYDARNKSFLQTDPKSQFFSPYSYTNGDPVNHIDYNGAVSKPLILYGEDHTKGGVDANFKDFKAAIKDAHYVSLSDFMTQDHIPLDDWNGNIYIEAHMSPKLTREITVELGNKPDQMKSLGSEGVYTYKTRGASNIYASVADAKVMGKRMQNLAKQNKVDLKNIVAGGCEGGPASQRMAEAYIAAGGKQQGLVAMGFKERWIPSIMGSHTAATYGLEYGYNQSRIYLMPKDHGVKHDVFEYFTPEGKPRGAVLGFKVLYGKEFKSVEEFAQGDQLEQFANGEPPASIGRFLDIYPY